MSERPWYKWWEWFAPIIIIIILVIPYIPWRPQCLPDLLVKDYTTGIVTGDYKVNVIVINDGCAESDRCFVYCNALTSPSGYPRAQEYWTLEELQPGETAAHSFSFNAQMLDNEAVDIIEILVDSKEMVLESNEDNNKVYIWRSINATSP